jgi:hypothetical protein
MGSTIFLIVVVASLPFAVLNVPFIKALQAEAPDVWASFGKPTVGLYLLRKSVLMPYSRLILFREYRSVLASAPRARAWASWLYIAHWLQLLAVAAWIVTIARN